MGHEVENILLRMPTHSLPRSSAHGRAVGDVTRGAGQENRGGEVDLRIFVLANDVFLVVFVYVCRVCGETFGSDLQLC